MPANPLAQKPKTKKDKAHIQAILRQIVQEPLEIARDATAQVGGSGKYDADPQVSQKPQEKPLTPEEMQKKQKKDMSHMQAFQEELREIQRLQKQREQERQQLRVQEEQQKKERAAQAANAQPFIEPVGKKVRGMLGGAMQGMKKKIHDSERKTEIQKTPSN
jgi:hypothetical protein